MMLVRRSDERGGGDHGWLRTRHTFSFADYYDPRWMSFRALRVLNEDVVEPGHGFPRHSHRDAEIVSLVLEGSLEHKDSLGSGSVIRPGDVQRMSAGTGVSHSEYNPSKSERLHFLQIWFLPDRQGYAPSYEQRAFSEEQRRDRLALLASHDGRDGSVTLHQDAALYMGTLTPGKELDHDLAPGRYAWVQVTRGRVRAFDQELGAGDGAAIGEERKIALTALEPSEVVLFDLG
jgi:redox-sensitive bicupin YhaK (pirin superfamily)